MHEIIDQRGGIEQINSSGQYTCNRNQIYHGRNSDTSQSRKVGASYPSNDLLVQLLQISKEQQLETKN